MKKAAFTIWISLLSFLCFGQTTQTRYFNSEWAGKEVPPDKAKYAHTIIQTDDGMVTTEIRDLKKDEIASRFEAASDTGKINISAYTYDLIKEQFQCKYRGRVNVKGKGEIDMYFVDHSLLNDENTGAAV